MKVGEEEDEVCNRDGCQGVMELKADRLSWGGCTCFVRAPCMSCLSWSPTCSECGFRVPSG